MKHPVNLFTKPFSFLMESFKGLFMCPGASIQCCFSSLCVIFHSVSLRRHITKQVTSKLFKWSTQEPTIPDRQS